MPQHINHQFFKTVLNLSLTKRKYASKIGKVGALVPTLVYPRLSKQHGAELTVWGRNQLSGFSQQAFLHCEGGAMPTGSASLMSF